MASLTWVHEYGKTGLWSAKSSVAAQTLKSAHHRLFCTWMIHLSNRYLSGPRAPCLRLQNRADCSNLKYSPLRFRFKTSCWPFWTIFPFFITITWSDCSARVTRCVTIRIIMLCSFAKRFIVSKTSFSNSTSKALVGSSKSNSSGGLQITRARPIRCLSPPLGSQVAPTSPRPSRMMLFKRTSRSDAFTWCKQLMMAWLLKFRPTAIFSRRLSGNIGTTCGNKATEPLPWIWPLTSNSLPARARKRVVFPEPLAPTIATNCLGRTLNEMSCNRGLLFLLRHKSITFKLLCARHVVPLVGIGFGAVSMVSWFIVLMVSPHSLISMRPWSKSRSDNAKLIDMPNDAW